MIFGDNVVKCASTMVRIWAILGSPVVNGRRDQRSECLAYKLIPEKDSLCNEELLGATN